MRAAIADFAARWHAMPPIAGLSAALDAMAAPEADEVAALLGPVIEEVDWVGALICALIAELRRYPAFDPPFAPLRSDVQAGLMLYTGRHAAIGLGVGALDRLAAKKRLTGTGSIVFPGHATLIRVLDGGGATVSLWRGGWHGGAAMERCAPLGRHVLRDGEMLAIDRGTSFLVEHARRDMLLLHATIFAGPAPTACEYDRATLALAGTGATSDQASRTQMLVGLLAAIGRDDAAAFEAASRAPERFVRWHAMREWLAFDADAAALRLVEIAETDPDAELRALATETIALIAEPIACHS